MESPQKETLTSLFKKSDFSFIQEFNQIVDLLLNGNNADAVGKSVTQLEEKFEHAKQVLESLPGLQYTKEQQENILAEETKSYKQCQ
ncbi:uncharacterized protein B0P05DRAFT_564966 [Gilbertella persicaria]|uniref:uncharacterized protein n=1 Tax=Gilbertella persicaria TaxID=101096 RepID=UPI00221E5F36|nr:uncharacterized protein B0P05DRAFT_564966 [Gilbertella persicaria]KAI8047944.1 hypothetical protein B0P05DRAFT_564966 [Gilbertella persicaria]